jgi:hypothetical protein
MAAPGGKFFIQEKLKTPAKHHESFEQLWETKWKKPVCPILALHPPNSYLFATSEKILY